MNDCPRTTRGELLALLSGSAADLARALRIAEPIAPADLADTEPAPGVYPAAEGRPAHYRGAGNFYVLEGGALLSGAICADGSLDWDSLGEVEPYFLSAEADASESDEPRAALAALEGR